MSVFQELLQGLDFLPAAHWIPRCPFVSLYAAQALSKIYEGLAGLVGKLVKFQIRALVATEERELQQIDSELLPYPDLLNERILALQQAYTELKEAVLKEQEWREGAIKKSKQECFAML
jgi:hypothetical protein